MKMHFFSLFLSHLPNRADCVIGDRKYGVLIACKRAFVILKARKTDFARWLWLLRYQKTLSNSRIDKSCEITKKIGFRDVFP